MYDSRVDTHHHINRVRHYISLFINSLLKRQVEHDQSKLESPEVELFNIYSDRLRGLTYGSDEYKRCLEEMKPATEHHYANNSHHPEYYKNGICGMDLMDLTEMIADWKAASERHANGDIYKSIEINQKRFGYSDELKQIFLNTVNNFFKNT